MTHLKTHCIKHYNFTIFRIPSATTSLCTKSLSRFRMRGLASPPGGPSTWSQVRQGSQGGERPRGMSESCQQSGSGSEPGQNLLRLQKSNFWYEENQAYILSICSDFPDHTVPQVCHNKPTNSSIHQVRYQALVMTPWPLSPPCHADPCQDLSQASDPGTCPPQARLVRTRAGSIWRT